MAAEQLARGGAGVTLFDQAPSVGRKFLLAGRGGLNLTHSEEVSAMLGRYGSSSSVVAPAIERFGPAALRDWCADLGEPTFVGSSGRVFPESFRATRLLRAWLARLDELGVEIEVRQRWVGWAEPASSTPELQRVIFADRDGVERVVEADAVVLALGGASWPQLGSDGRWVDTLDAVGVSVAELEPANCGFTAEWSAEFSRRFAGVPLKNVRLTVGPAASRGEVMITDTGVEGGGVYAVGSALRALTTVGSGAVLEVDLQPDRSVPQVRERLEGRRPKESQTSMLRRTLSLAPVAIGLMREATGNDLPADLDELARLVKAVPLSLGGPEPIARAISSAGGVRWSELDAALMLERRPGTFVVGEMIDWEAPTGGYLLQATFSQAVIAAEGALSWLGSGPR